MQMASSVKVLVIGHRRVGKTTILKKFRDIASVLLGDRHTADEKQGGVNLTVDSLSFSEATLFDLPCSRRLAISTADAFILTYAADDVDSYCYVTSLIKDVREVKGEYVPLIVVSNKSDIEVPIGRRIMTDCILTIDYECDHVEVSAISGKNLQKVFTLLLEYCGQHIVFPEGKQDDENDNNKNKINKDRKLKKGVTTLFRRLLCIAPNH